MTSNTRTREGFTLIEIVIAIFIVALITGVVGTFVVGQVAKAKKNTTRVQLKNIQEAIEAYSVELGEYPKTLEALITTPADERLASRWEKYLKTDKIPRVPWNNLYIYQVTPGGAHDFELYSEGPDKKQKIDVWESR